VAVKNGTGSSTASLHPELAGSRIREGVAAAVQGLAGLKPVVLPPHFNVVIRYKEHYNAFRNSFYPGARLADPMTLHFEADNYFEVLRLLQFVA
jgi:D-amino peptidase